MHIAVLAGDGIGPEVTAQAVKALRALAANGPQFEFTEAPIGDAAYDAAGDPLPEATLPMLAERADAVLFGAAGTYESDLRPPEARGGHGLLRLRKRMDLFANFRPVFAFPELLGASTLKREVIEGVDLVVLRELTGDIYFGTAARRRARERRARRHQHHALHRGRDPPRRACRLPGRAASGGANCARSTRPTCWRPARCGARWSPRSRATTRTSS